MKDAKNGKLFGVGVGPGDSELLTLKGLRIINQCNVIAYPGKREEDTFAYEIIAPVAKNLDEKTFIDCYVKMTKDKEVLAKNYNSIADKIEKVLQQGEDIAFLTIGDPTVYATYMYVHQLILERGYEAEIISGVPSFCAVAGKLGISLAERSEQLHIIPASYQVEEALALPGNKVLMKSASKLGEIKEILLQREDEVYMVENCGMKDERIFRSAKEIDETAGYLSLMIVKEKKK